MNWYLKKNTCKISSFWIEVLKVQNPHKYESKTQKKLKKGRHFSIYCVLSMLPTRSIFSKLQANS